jgi:leucyl aminopeptidase (aminopeptidase T)
VAAQIVDGLFRVAPGEQVVLRGGPRYLRMMEAIAIEVLGAGGKAHILATTDGEWRYRAQQLPLEYLGPPPSSIDSALTLQSDLEINLAYDSDFRSIWPDLTSERFKRHQRSNAVLSELNERSTRRYLYLAMPSQPEVVAAVKGLGLDSTTYTGLWWEAAAADIDGMADRGAMLRRRLEGAKQVRVTTPNGTDFTFTPSDRAVHVDVATMSRAAAHGQPWSRRQASFPAGLATVIPIEATVTGRVRLAADQCDRPVSQEAFELRAGRPHAVRAANDEACIQAGLAKAGAVGSLSIGLNPAMKPVLTANGNFLPEQSLGLVSLGFGDNVRFGGTNAAPRWSVPLTGATVMADGVAVIREGRLVAGPGRS